MTKLINVQAVYDSLKEEGDNSTWCTEAKMEDFHEGRLGKIADIIMEDLWAGCPEVYYMLRCYDRPFDINLGVCYRLYWELLNEGIESITEEQDNEINDYIKHLWRDDRMEDAIYKVREIVGL